MSLEATLELLGSILADHKHRLEDRSSTVIHCVHESADTIDDADVMASVIRRAGGAYFRCHPDLDDLSFRGPLHRAMATHIEQLASHRGIELSISEVRGRVVTSVQGVAELTGSAATLAQAISLLCSAELDTELVVFSYPTAELDEARASLIWEAATSASQLRPNEIRTLVPITLGWVDVVRHCNPLAGAVKYVVRDGELIRRQTRRTPDTRLNKILMSVDDPIVLFLGAGASASCRIPQGNALRDAAINVLTGANLASEDLLPSFRQYLDDHPNRYLNGEPSLSRSQFEDSLTLERVLREEFHELSGRPRADAPTVRMLSKVCAEALQWDPPGRRALRELAAVLPRLVVAMVNFDELVEDGLSAEHQVVASADEFASAIDLVVARVNGSTDVLPVLKLHGTITRPDTLVADIDATTVGLPRAIEDALDAMISAQGRVTWVWIGCSMRDVDLRQWLRRKDAAEITEFWVDPLPPISVTQYAAEVRQTQWAFNDQTLADRQITESSDVFLPALLERAKAIAAR